MDIETGLLSVGRHSAEKQFNSFIMLDGIKMEEHLLRSGQATLGVMLGESCPHTLMEMIGRHALVPQMLTKLIHSIYKLMPGDALLTFALTY